MLPFLFVAALIGSPAQQSTAAGGQVAVSNGDTILFPAGYNGRLLSRRTAEIQIAATADPREVIVLIDEQKDTSPPDGFVDRVHRHVLSNEFPPDYVYRGKATLEEVQQITDGRVSRMTMTTLVTPLGRLRFAGSPPEATQSGDIVFRTTSGQTRELMPISYSGSRTFEDVLPIWVNHLEDSQSTVRTSLRMTVPPGAVVQGPSTQTTASVTTVPHAGVAPPEAMMKVSPGYTASAFRRGIEGTVDLELTVMPTGSVSDARVTRSLDPELDREAVRAALKWTFRPALENGRAVTDVVRVGMTFSLTRQDK